MSISGDQCPDEVSLRAAADVDQIAQRVPLHHSIVD